MLDMDIDKRVSLLHGGFSRRRSFMVEVLEGMRQGSLTEREASVLLTLVLTRFRSVFIYIENII
jgi:hypothetical protein